MLQARRSLVRIHMRSLVFFFSAPNPSSRTLVPGFTRIFMGIKAHVIGRVNPRAVERLEGLGQLKKSSDLIILEPVTFRLVA
jgi:hypothetical protein